MNIYHKYHVDKMTEREVYITLGEVLTKLEQVTHLVLSAKYNFRRLDERELLYALGYYEDAENSDWPEFNPVKDLGLESADELKGGVDKC